jgi:hypothetical protein
VVLTPPAGFATVRVGGAELTTTVGLLVLVPFSLVDTVKLKLVVGAVALKVTSTVEPAGIVQEDEVRVTLKPYDALVVAEPV